MRRALPLYAVLILAGVTLCFGGCRPTTPPDPRPPAISAVELDHLFVFAPAQSTEADVVAALTEAGLHVAAYRNEFPDGVTGRYVWFENGYLEVLWYDGRTLADSSTQRTASWEHTGASPFGVGLRRQAGTPETLPFPTRGHTGVWMEPGTEMRLLGRPADTLAPSLFVVPRSMAYPDSSEWAAWLASLPADRREQEAASREHPLGVRQITGARMAVLPHGLSDAAQALSRSGIVHVAEGPAPLLEVTLDGGARGGVRDLRPLLPLQVRY